jgi:hypothetical protein
MPQKKKPDRDDAEQYEYEPNGNRPLKSFLPKLDYSRHSVQWVPVNFAVTHAVAAARRKVEKTVEQTATADFLSLRQSMREL